MDATYSNYSPTVLYVEKFSFSKKWVYDDAYVPYCIVRYIHSGSAIFTVNDVSYQVVSGDVFYIPQGCRLMCKALDDVVFTSIRFVGNIQVSEIDTLNQLWGFRQLYHMQDHPNIWRWFEEIYHSAISRVTYKRMITRGYLNLICAELAKFSGENMESEDSLQQEDTSQNSIGMEYIRHRAAVSQVKIDPRIQSLADYIVLHPEENLSRERMCEMCNVSESTLRRLFKSCMGKSLTVFIKETKMILAAHLLVTSNEPISEIGYQLGYETPSYFTKTFRETFGVSPNEYRKTSLEA